MKNSLALAFLLSIALMANGQKKNNFGKTIDDKGAVTATSLSAKMGGKEVAQLKVSGVVESVCQVKGCWIQVKLSDGETMRVKFKDYGFFVPKDIAGRTVVMEGEAKIKTTPVAELQHYAQDAGKSKEEIANITQPKRELSFVADGVLLKP